MRRALIVTAVCAFLTVLFPVGCAVSPPSVKPGDARSYYERGIYYSSKPGQRAQAIADWTTAIQIDPNFVEAYIRRGRANVAVDWQAFVRDFDKAIALCPGDHRLYYTRGNAHAMNDDIDKAVADYDMVITLNPQSPEAYWSYYKKPQRLESHGRIKEAIKAYEEFIEKAGPMPASPQSPYKTSVVTGAVVGSLSTGNAFGAAVGLAAGLLPLLDLPKPRAHEDNQALARERIAELREIELVYQDAGRDVTLSSIAVGMNRRQVIARTLGDGYFIPLKRDVEAAVSRSGNIEDRILMVLTFQDGILVSRKDFGLSELVALPDIKSQTVYDRTGGRRSEIEEALRQTAKIIFADDDCLAAVGYDSVAGGKRILVFGFSGDKMAWCAARSRKLW